MLFSRGPLPLLIALFALGVQGKYVLPMKGPAKYDQWLPLLSRKTVERTSKGACNATLAEYRLQWEESDEHLDKACQAHSECILNEMSENAKAYMSSSSLVLGLSPVLLSTLGPSISEIGLLSLNRPVLSVMLSLGTVATYPSRALSYSDDSCHDILERSTTLPVSIIAMMSQRRGFALYVSVAEYLIIALAVFNVFYTSWQLGVATILNFICQSSFMPIIWTTLPVLVHLPAALAFRFSLVRETKTKTPERSTFKLVLSRIASEAKLCISHKPLAPSVFKATPVVLGCHWLASLFGFVHVIFGILIYSSLLFTMTTDAAVVLLRYFASALACRLVLMFELSGMKWAQNGKGGEVADTEYLHLEGS